VPVSSANVAAFGGRANLKHQVASRVSLDVAAMPYRGPVASYLERSRADGRRLVLATAANRVYAEQVAAHMNIFDEVIASDRDRNLKGPVKADVLVERFGHGGFDYLGDSRSDLPVWRAARGALVVNASPSLERELAATGRVLERFTDGDGGARDYIRTLRPYQWLKNLLVYVPDLTAHQLTNPEVLITSTIAFMSFSISASGVYLLNDLFDLEEDRHHERKRLRPLPSGALSLRHAMVLGPALIAVGIILALSINATFFWILLGYLFLTTAYTLVIKRIALLDVLLLAGLYTIRVLAGGAASGVGVSFWLLTFAIFLFFSLALAKRYAELTALDPARAETGIAGRGYRADDRWTLLGLGLTSGLMTVLVLALYIQSDKVRALYEQPTLLWLLCPVLMYWISRTWLLAGRKELIDDPVLFAVRDPTSYLVLAVVLAVMMIAA
jgi:4-hydroxybenzoate polyprenyltransferase